jgi:hypothetical protein
MTPPTRQATAVRARAAAGIRPLLPKTGWLVREFETGTPFVPTDALLRSGKAEIARR